jgi:hypothetical protein
MRIRDPGLKNSDSRETSRIRNTAWMTAVPNVVVFYEAHVDCVLGVKKGPVVLSSGIRDAKIVNGYQCFGHKFHKIENHFISEQVRYYIEKKI